MGRVTSVLRPDNTTLSYVYDANGNMTILSNPALIGHGFDHNAVSKRTSYQAPLSGSYQYVYDKDRRLLQKIFPSGATITNIYDTIHLSQV